MTDPLSEPAQEKPPLIQNPAVAIPSTPGQTPRQLLALVLNVCLALFLADAIVSLLDDTLINLAGSHLLTGARGVIATLALLPALLVYILMGLSPSIPKRLFLPVTLLNPLVLLLSFPVLIYFFTRNEQVSWIFSLAQLGVGFLVLRHIHGAFKVTWPLVPVRLIQGPLFSWVNLLAFVGFNIVVLLPAVIGYLALCSALAVDHYSDGFVALRPQGFTVQVRKYVRADGKSVLLVPMSHIGEPEFYRGLSHSFPTNATILMEGVQDENNLLTNRITYKRMANTLGLAQQQTEFKPSPVQIVMADIDVDQFSPRTIDFLNLVMLIHSRGLNPENLLLLMQSSQSTQFVEQVFDDILRKRNQHLFQEIQNHLASTDNLIVPWGAAHMPEIARDVQNSGFKLESSKDYIAVRFGHQRNAHFKNKNAPDTN